MNIFNLVGEKLDGSVFPGYEPGPVPYIVDMPISPTSNMTLESLASMLLSPILYTVVQDKRFKARHDTHIVINCCVPHLIVVVLLEAFLSQWDKIPRVWINEGMRGLVELGDAMNYQRLKETYENLHCTDWKKNVNQKSDFIDNKENN